MSHPAKPRTTVLVGRTVCVRAGAAEPDYFTAAHRRFVGKSGRVHAVVDGRSDNPLIKVGFGEPEDIVFFRLADLEVDRDADLQTRKHGRRGSHLP